MSSEDKDELLDRDWSSAWDSLPEAPALVPRRKTAQVTLRLPTSLLARVKRVAAVQDLPYHALTRSWLQEGLRESSLPPSGAAHEPNVEQLNVKLGQDVLDALKARAHEVRRPYHRLAREWVEAAVVREEKRLGLAATLDRSHEDSRHVGSRRKRSIPAPAARVEPGGIDEIYELDDLSRAEFDRVITRLLESRGYSNVRAALDSEGFGADIIAARGGLTYAIHTKQVLTAVPVSVIRQAIGGMAYHDADRALVIANSLFTDSARDAAREAGVELVDRFELTRWLSRERSGIVATAITPRPYQVEALTTLRMLRDRRERRALVVMAPGLGKTYVAALDVQQYERAVGRQVRVLYVSHQAVILHQAHRSFSMVFGPSRMYGYFDADRRDLEADFVFASFQSLYRHLDECDPDHFDYLIIDEAHHTAAPTRDAVVRHFAPRFTLGLTATPFRADGRDITAYYGDVLASSIPLERAVAHGLLAPIDYRVVSDDVDRDALAATLRAQNGAENGEVFRPVSDETIVETVMDEATVVDGRRKILVFCATLAQMDHFARLFPESRTISSRDTRTQQISAVEDLRAGRIEVLLSRDVLNEGIDIPHATTLVFLRNTESATVFLQQLGRGLRRTEGKERVDVFDFVNTLARIELLYRFFSRLESEQVARRTHGELAPNESSSLALDQTAREVVDGLLDRKRRSGSVADLSSIAGALEYGVSVHTLRRIVHSGRLIPDFVAPGDEERTGMLFDSRTVEQFMRQVHSQYYTAGLLSALEFARRIEKPVAWVRGQERRGALAAAWVHRRSSGALEPYYEPDDVLMFESTRE